MGPVLNPASGRVTGRSGAGHGRDGLGKPEESVGRGVRDLRPNRETIFTRHARVAAWRASIIILRRKSTGIATHRLRSAVSSSGEFRFDAAGRASPRRSVRRATCVQLYTSRRCSSSSSSSRGVTIALLATHNVTSLC